MKFLENEQIKLRALEPEDIELMMLWENDTEMWTVSNTIAPYSRFLLKQFIESTINQSVFECGQLKLIIERKDDKKAIGVLDLFDLDIHHKRAGVGIMISKTEDRNKGYASQSINLIIDYSFNYLKIKQLFCNIYVDNLPSLNVFLKAGFRISGTKFKWSNSPEGWLDEYFLQLINH